MEDDKLFKEAAKSKLPLVVKAMEEYKKFNKKCLQFNTRISKLRLKVQSENSEKKALMKTLKMKHPGFRLCIFTHTPALLNKAAQYKKSHLRWNKVEKRNYFGVYASWK